MKTLAQKLGVTTGTTTVTVDRLEKSDYAKRETTKEDRRVNLISLTEQLICSLSQEETEQFYSILKKINENAF